MTALSLLIQNSLFEGEIRGLYGIYSSSFVCLTKEEYR